YCRIYITYSRPHQGPCGPHPTFVVRPGMIVLAEMVTAVVPVPTFLRPCQLVGGQLGMIVISIVSRRRQPSLHVRERSQSCLHDFQPRIVEIILVEFAVQAFVEVGTGLKSSGQQTDVCCI